MDRRDLLTKSSSTLVTKRPTILARRSQGLYLYGRSFFLEDKPIAPAHREAVDYFLGQSKKFWLQLDCRQSQGHLALGS